MALNSGVEDGGSVRPIPDEDRLLRRIGHWQFNFEKNRIYDIAFRNQKTPTGQLLDRHSVNWWRHTTIEGTLEGNPGFGVASLTAGAYREHGQTVEHSPDLATRNYAHCDAIGEKPAGVQSRLRKAASLERAPTPPTESDSE